MTLADHTAYKAARATPQQKADFLKTLTTVASAQMSWWRTAGYPAQPAIPGTAAAALDRTTAGALDKRTTSGGGGSHVFPVSFDVSSNALQSGIAYLCDRLVHNGGRDATLTTAQAVGGTLPARATGGAGVLGGIEIYTQIGATATTVTPVVVDQAGSSTSAPDIAIGGTGRREAGVVLPISMPAGATGLREITSLQLLATTGTAGSFGGILYRPLLAVPLFGGFGVPPATDQITALGCQLAPIPEDACLFWLTVCSDGGSRTLRGRLGMADA